MSGLHDPLEECVSLARTWAIAKRGAETADHVVEPDIPLPWSCPRLCAPMLYHSSRLRSTPN